MWTPDNPSEFRPPAPDPKRPWALTHNDRWFLRGLKIDPEDATTPFPVREITDDED